MRKPNQKLYLARREVETLFVSDLSSPQLLTHEANRYLKEEAETNYISVFDNPIIEEITSPLQIPSSWENSSLVWGTNEDITAADFLAQPIEDPEYQLFLRLKQRFEP